MIPSVAQQELEQPVRRWIKNLVSGAGSIIVIAPPASVATYREFLPEASVEDTLRADWWAVGDDIAKALTSIEQGPEWGAQAERNENDDR